MRGVHLHRPFSLLAAGLLFASRAMAAADFVAFESGPVRPLALSADGNRLFAVNTPGNQLEVFSVGVNGALTRSAVVPVGLEPVAVAVRSATEVWVVNHLSDSVSIVDVGALPRVTRTLLVGDEPRDIVFAGTAGNRAFITAAHRGQNINFDPRLTNQGQGRTDIWVFDADNLGNNLAGNPIRVLKLFGDTARALAKTADGSIVYAAAFHSGNQTTTLNEQVVCNGGAASMGCVVDSLNVPGGLPAPNANVDGIPGPEVGLIVKFNNASGHWEDTLGRDWDNGVRFDLPDQDVFAIDANASPPVELSNFAHVGTVLFNMVVHPTNGKVYVSNLDSRNEVRFEGPGILGTTVRGHLAEAHITVLDGVNVLPRHLNKHINYSVVPAPTAVKAASLSMPTDMVLSSAGSTLYVAAFGSNQVGIFDTAQLDADTFTPSAASHIAIPGGLPGGLALHQTHNRLYVLSRFDNAVSAIDLATKLEAQRVGLLNPEQFKVKQGRRFLYDAQITSSNGEASCASCHIFGDNDDLAWDLGNPDDSVLVNLNQFRLGPLGNADFHPMKGPMTTQTLRGMATHGPMHWRGDRSGANDPGGSFSDEDAAFKRFNPAFEGLIGRSEQLTADQMQAFTDFILSVLPPPNPVRALDNSLTADEQAGRDFYFDTVSDGFFPCNGCHKLAPALGFFGTDGTMTFEGETQHLKIAHLRNAYTKVGMFGMPDIPGIIGGGNNNHRGDQIRGFGFLHDGSVDTVFRFVSGAVFDFGDGGNTLKRQVESFVLAFDSNFAPIVGQQITLTSTNAATADPRIDLLLQRAAAGECDVVVKGTVLGEARGYYRLGSGDFKSDHALETPVSDAALRALALVPGQELTYTAVPPGNGLRIGVDRDRDNALDADEVAGATDPDNDLSQPMTAITCPTNILSNAAVKITRNNGAPGDERISVKGLIALEVANYEPRATGLRFKIVDKDGNNLFYRAVSGGEPLVKNAPGWAISKSKRKWLYKDRFAAPGTLSKVIVRQDKDTAIYRFNLKAKDGNFQVAASALPLSVVAVLGAGDESDSGACGVANFNPSSGSRPRCRISTSGATISCR